MTAVMKGIRILEVAEHTFVPAASAILADWGADVIKIEHAERGDAARGLGKTGTINLGGNVTHVLVDHANRGKRSLGLDLSTPDGVDLLYRLAAECDVFLTNKNPGVRQRLKIDVDDIRAHNPSIIYVRGSGYGPRGPDADRGGYDILAYWCRAGSALAVRPPGMDRVPMMPGPAYGDSIGAMTIAGGISAALLHRERTGEAPVVDVSLLSTGMWAMGASIAIALQTGEMWQQPSVDGPWAGNPLTFPYRTADGRYIALSCLQGFHYWPEMCRVIERDELVTDDRFSTVEAFARNGGAAATILADVFASATAQEWYARLATFKGQWSPVQDALEAAHDPQSEANGYIGEARTRDGVPFSLVTTPVQFDETPALPKRAPEFNEHGDEILLELGLDMDAVLDLKIRGVVA